MALKNAGMIKHVQRVTRAEGGPRQWAIKHGYTGQAIYRILDGHGDPGEKLAKALGLRKIVTWEVIEEKE